jgi:hypothetical protein
MARETDAAEAAWQRGVSSAGIEQFTRSRS